MENRATIVLDDLWWTDLLEFKTSEITYKAWYSKYKGSFITAYLSKFNNTYTLLGSAGQELREARENAGQDPSAKLSRYAVEPITVFNVIEARLNESSS